ncbi:peptide ABC transporter permease [Sinorhizobium sp. GW3]|nr:peptide ABC transporter permease [Sinorhizobium sp. GW3]
MKSASLRIHLAFKLATAILAVVGAVSLLMALTRLVPGDPATVILGSRATPEAVAALNARIGLDKSVVEQVAGFFGRLAIGDLGEDVFNGRPVLELVLGALPNTAALAVSAMLCAVAFGVPLALLSARWPGGMADRLVAFMSVGFISTPSFVVSVFLLMAFSVTLRWFPVLGAGDDGDGDLRDQLWHLALPTAALAAGWIGYIARLLRSSLLEVLSESHIRTLRAYGVSETKILMKYALKPAILPTVAVLGMGFGELLGGAVFAEVIFNRPGLGSLIYDAIRTRNYPIVQGGVFVIVLLYVATNLIADLSQSLIDPRERSRLNASGGN